jgi:hypothetical protein
MSRPIGCEHGRATVASDTQPILDYGWWASNGPTAGYLMRLAADATAERCPAHGGALRIGLDVARLASAAPYVLTVGSDVGTSGIAHNLVAFHQGGPFAVASVLTAAGSARPAVSDVTPPAALLTEAYGAMATPSPTLPPVTGRFVYRPTADLDGPEPRPGWDVVWLTPTDPRLGGRALVASVIDSWYPAHFMRAVREHLRTGLPLEQPGPTVLVAASLSFTAPDPAYERARHLLLANQLTSTTGGHSFERSEVWSDGGALLATAELVRKHPSAGHSPDPSEERGHEH